MNSVTQQVPTVWLRCCYIDVSVVKNCAYAVCNSMNVMEENSCILLGCSKTEPKVNAECAFCVCGYVRVHAFRCLCLMSVI